MVDPLSYFLFQPVLHYWYNKGFVISCPVCKVVQNKRSLAANRKEILDCSGDSVILFAKWMVYYVI